MSTPPVSTSTPLPPDDHPLLLVNRNKPTIDDATIIQLLQNGGMPSFSHDNTDSGLEEPSPSSETEDQNQTVQNEPNLHCRESKFDKGTIKLNMAEKSQKEILKTAKIINISIEPTTKSNRRRSHVKDIFSDDIKSSNTKRSESCRSPTRPPPSPQRERASSMMNILSTPHATRRRQQIQVTPPQNQLQDASSTAKMQIKQELTGKRLLLSPNVPVAPNSPVSNFFRKVLHTENVEHKHKNIRKIGGSLESFGQRFGSLDSFGHGLDGNKSNMAAGISKWRSAYDFVTESETDED